MSPQKKKIVKGPDNSLSLELLRKKSYFSAVKIARKSLYGHYNFVEKSNTKYKLFFILFMYSTKLIGSNYNTIFKNILNTII